MDLGEPLPEAWPQLLLETEGEVRKEAGEDPPSLRCCRCPGSGTTPVASTDTEATSPRRAWQRAAGRAAGSTAGGGLCPLEDGEGEMGRERWGRRTARAGQGSPE